jgi:hypothetical protein
METTGVVSAATLIAAVLEHQGYMTQARFLADFQDFFRDAGALVYLMSGVGAVISVAMYGSFRAARYLLVGPALFWFLVGPTTQTEGVHWKLGDGPYRGILRHDGKGEADADRKEILEKLNQTGQGVDGDIDVAVGFWLFAKPISDFVNEMVGIILEDEEQGDLMVGTKTHGLDIIHDYLPNDTEFVQRLESGLYNNCKRMMSAAQAASWTYVKGKVDQGISGNASTEKLDEINKHHIEQVTEFGKRPFSIDRTGFDVLIKAHIEHNGDGEIAKKFKKKSIDEPVDEISCADAWELVAKEVWHHAGRAIPRVLLKVTNIADYDEAKDYACAQLSAKAVSEGNADVCNLRPAFAMAILHRHLMRADTFGRVMERHWNESVHRNPSSKIGLVSSANSNEFTAYLEAGKIALQRTVDQLGRYTQSVLLGGHNITQSKGGGFDVDQYFRWSPYGTMTALYGRDHAMSVATRQHETQRLRGEMFTWAMQLPYYQGIALFLISVAYPFVAIVVILPGKAMNFINMPMAYLWIKSWDIGFAGVIVLDKVMYNLLPSKDLPEALQQGPWIELDKLPLVLSEAYYFDSAGATHTYYAIISMVWLAVPALTGAVTVKAKRGLLSSFTDGATQQAKDAGQRHAAAFSIVAQNRRTIMMKEIQGHARRSPMLGAGGIESGMKLQSAHVWGTMKSISTAMREGTKADAWGKGSFGQGPLAAAGDGATTYWKTRQTMLTSETKLESELRYTFDESIGRWGSFGMLFDAYTSAMDGGGGFEMNDHKANAVDALNDAYILKQDLAMSIQADLANTKINMIGNAARFEVSALLGKNGGIGIGVPELTLMAKFAQDRAEDGSIYEFLRKDSKAYTDEEFMARVFNIHPENNRTPGQKRSDPMAQLFSALAPNMTPGGSKSYVQTLLGATGGDRILLPGQRRHFATRAEAEKYIRENSKSAQGSLAFVFGGETPAESNKWEADFLRNSDAGTRELLYDRPLESQRNFIISVFGENELKSYFSGVDSVKSLSIGQLAEYTSHLNKANPSDDPFYGFDPQVLQLSGKMTQANAISQWIMRRSGTSASGSIDIVYPDHTFTTKPGDIFPSYDPTSAGNIDK